MRYWDSSAIVPLLVDQPKSNHSRSLLAEDEVMLTWWSTAPECVSAICRLEREEAITPMEADMLVDRVNAFSEAWLEVAPSLNIKTLAKRLLRVHPLRAMDALQLAAALIATEHHPVGVDFVCYDERLAMAARREGFKVIE